MYLITLLKLALAKNNLSHPVGLLNPSQPKTSFRLFSVYGLINLLFPYTLLQTDLSFLDFSSALESFS